MKIKIPNIYFYKFIFYMEALEDMQLPEYKGSMFRGAFGWGFRNPVCVTGMPTCNNCLMQSHCAYFKVFETEISGHNIPFLKGVKKVPHPIVIHPQIDNKTFFKKGEIIRVGLTVFGNIIQYFPYFVYTFMQMGKRGLGYKRQKLKLLSVSSFDLKGTESIVFNDEDKKLLTNYKKIDCIIFTKKKTQRKSIVLNFHTPFRVQELGIITDPTLISPALIIRNIERRIITISHFFCGSTNIELFTEINKDEIFVADNKLSYYSWKRYSSRQHKSIYLEGFMGKITLRGNINKFYPLLLIGEKINIGGKTIFGLGEYKIERK